MIQHASVYHRKSDIAPAALLCLGSAAVPLRLAMLRGGSPSVLVKDKAAELCCNDTSKLCWAAAAAATHKCSNTRQHIHCYNHADLEHACKRLIPPVFLCRLNWQLHFGGPPKWAPGVKFILVDVEPSPGDANKAAVVLRGDARLVVRQLTEKLQGGGAQLQQGKISTWRQQLAKQVSRHLPYVLGIWLAECQTRGAHEGMSLLVLNLETGAYSRSTVAA